MSRVAIAFSLFGVAFAVGSDWSPPAAFVMTLAAVATIAVVAHSARVARNSSVS
jgi:hypothetical protein